jgi:hypothetical protein
MTYLCWVEFNSRDETGLLFKQLVVMPEDKVNQPTEPKADVEATPMPPAEDTKAVQPFALLLEKESSAAHLDENSNLSKILKKHQLIKLLSFTILSDKSFTPSLYNCIWCIGLAPELEEKLRGFEHSNILFSPNIENLSSKEDKLKMYIPFQKFMERNKDVFSHL